MIVRHATGPKINLRFAFCSALQPRHGTDHRRHSLHSATVACSPKTLRSWPRRRLRRRRHRQRKLNVGDAGFGVGHEVPLGRSANGAEIGLAGLGDGRHPDIQLLIGETADDPAFAELGVVGGDDAELLFVAVGPRFLPGLVVEFLPDAQAAGDVGGIDPPEAVSGAEGEFCGACRCPGRRG